ncbi:MAG: OsmC family protein [Gemmatimonadales bacterium]
MTHDELRAVQTPIKQRYRDHPEVALVTLAAEGSLDGAALTCRVDTGRALVVAGLHPATGGTGMQACSGDMLLEALVACAGVTVQAVATAIGLTLVQGTVRAEGDLDFRGTLGVDREAPVGFREIRLSFALDLDATAEQRETLLRLTERYCVVLQTLRGSAKLNTTLRTLA